MERFFTVPTRRDVRLAPARSPAGIAIHLSLARGLPRRVYARALGRVRRIKGAAQVRRRGRAAPRRYQRLIDAARPPAPREIEAREQTRDGGKRGPSPLSPLSLPRHPSPRQGPLSRVQFAPGFRA